MEEIFECRDNFLDRGAYCLIIKEAIVEYEWRFHQSGAGR